MGMMGLSIGDLIERASRFFKRQTHEREALDWQRTVGKITRYTTTSSGETLPLLDYDYTFEGQAYSGSFTGFKIRDEDIQRIGDLLAANSLLHIRVNPRDPAQSRVLNRENPRLPFDIDHLEH